MVQRALCLNDEQGARLVLALTRSSSSSATPSKDILVELSRKARENLALWVKLDTPTHFGWRNAFTTKLHRMYMSLGASEGVRLMLLAAEIDRNGDGCVSQEELDYFNAQGQIMIKNILDASLNSGLIASLLLALILPLSLTPPLDGSFGEQAINFFGSEGAENVELAFIIVLQLNVYLTAMIVYLNVRIYATLTIWLDTIESKMIFLCRSPRLLQCLNMSILLLFTTTWIAIGIGAALIRPELFLSALLVYMCGGLPTFYFLENNIFMNKVMLTQHREAKQLLLKEGMSEDGEGRTIRHHGKDLSLLPNGLRSSDHQHA